MQRETAAGELDIVALARANPDFRQVLVTGPHMQVVVMTIPIGDEIGAETHDQTDQMLFIVDGVGDAVLDGNRMSVASGHLVFVPAGTHHNVVNTGQVPLRIVTAYAPPEHEPGTIHRTRGEAEAAEGH